MRGYGLDADDECLLKEEKGGGEEREKLEINACPRKAGARIDS